MNIYRSPDDPMDVDTAVLASLPPSVQFDVAQKIKAKHFARNREGLQRAGEFCYILLNFSGLFSFRFCGFVLHMHGTDSNSHFVMKFCASSLLLHIFLCTSILSYRSYAHKYMKLQRTIRRISPRRSCFPTCSQRNYGGPWTRRERPAWPR